MTVRYVESVVGIRPEQLTEFLSGWPKAPSPRRHLSILARSDVVVLAIDDVDERVIGFANALTDGILSAYVPLLEVLPAHRGRGIGRGLVERILARLDGLYMVDLVCDDAFVEFYRALGFEPMRAMSRRDRDAQGGAGPELAGGVVAVVAGRRPRGTM